MPIFNITIASASHSFIVEESSDSTPSPSLVSLGDNIQRIISQHIPCCIIPNSLNSLLSSEQLTCSLDICSIVLKSAIQQRQQLGNLSTTERTAGLAALQALKTATVSSLFPYFIHAPPLILSSEGSGLQVEEDVEKQIELSEQICSESSSPCSPSTTSPDLKSSHQMSPMPIQPSTSAVALAAAQPVISQNTPELFCTYLLNIQTVRHHPLRKKISLSKKMSIKSMLGLYRTYIKSIILIYKSIEELMLPADNRILEICEELQALVPKVLRRENLHEIKGTTEPLYYWYIAAALYYSLKSFNKLFEEVQKSSKDLQLNKPAHNNHASKILTAIELCKTTCESRCESLIEGNLSVEEIFIFKPYNLFSLPHAVTRPLPLPSLSISTTPLTPIAHHHANSSDSSFSNDTEKSSTSKSQKRTAQTARLTTEAASSEKQPQPEMTTSPAVQSSASNNGNNTTTTLPTLSSDETEFILHTLSNSRNTASPFFPDSPH